MDVSPTSQTRHFQPQTAFFTIVPISFNKFIFPISQAKSWRVMLDSLSHIFVRKSYWLTTFCHMYGPSHHPCHLVDCNILLAGLYFHLASYSLSSTQWGILWKCTDPVTSAHTTRGSHLSKGQRLLLIKPYAHLTLPIPTFILLFSAHVSTVLIYSTHLGIQGALQTYQVPVRGSLPRNVFHLQSPPPYLQGPFLQAFPYHKVSPTVLFTFTMSHTACCSCSRLPVCWTRDSILSLLWGGESRSKQKVVKQIRNGIDQSLLVNRIFKTQFLFSNSNSRFPRVIEHWLGV